MVDGPFVLSMPLVGHGGWYGRGHGRPWKTCIALRAHHLGTDSDQADITADGNPHWKPKMTYSGPLGILSGWEENKRETRFYLGLFY